MKFLRRLLHTVVMYLLLLLLGLASLAWNLIALAALSAAAGASARARSAARPSRVIYRVFWSAAAALGILRIDAKALEALRDEPGGLIIAANHPSMLDALLVVAQLPRGVCIMKAALMRNVFLGPGAKLARYICNDSTRDMLRSAVANLREGGAARAVPRGHAHASPRRSIRSAPASR